MKPETNDQMVARVRKLVDIVFPELLTPKMFALAIRAIKNEQPCIFKSAEERLEAIDYLSWQHWKIFA